MSEAKNVIDMRKAGNAAIKEQNYEEAIKFYSKALLVRNIGVEEKSLLHSNRSHAYLQSAMKSGDDSGVNLLSLALQDANVVIKIRPTWWKGYSRAGQVYKYQKDWNLAIDRFNEALALNPGLVEVKNCRDECRFDKIQSEMGGNVMPHGFNEEIEKLNEVYGTKFNAEAIVKSYEKLMNSKDPKNRARGCVFFGVRHVKGIDGPKDIKKGVDLLQEAVDADSPEAMVELGVLYMQGVGVERNIKKAVSLFEKAANIDPTNKTYVLGEHDGIAHAQFHIGLCFENGTGKLLDYCEARRWYEKASERGHAGAANNLAILYTEGLGGVKCSVRAKQFFRLSASRGNTTAMESLAWKYLWEKDAEQAESWYAKALEAKNDHAIKNKDKFNEVLRNLRNFLESTSAECHQPSDSSEATTESKTKNITNLIDALEKVTSKPSITKFTAINDSPVARYWSNYDEIQKRAENGHPFAQTLLVSMCNFADGINHLKQLSATKMNPKDVASTQEQCIHNLADSLRATEIIVFFEPSEMRRLFKICETKISSRPSEVDLDARVVYCFLLSVSQHQDFSSFSRICCQMYPDEVFFYKMHAASFAVQQDFEASMKVSDQGLQKFPTNECLLYCKAGAMKMIKSCREEQVIAALKEFIKHAPFDERMLPEAYYCIAFYTSDDEQKLYYKKGVEAELQLLPCFLPYQSNMKSLLDALTVFEKRGTNGGPTTKKEPMKSSAATNNLQVTNPARIQSVRRHRETLKQMSETVSTYNFVTQLSTNPQHEQKMSKLPDNFKGIHLRDMNPHKDMVYDKRLINLLISEDPMFGLLSAIHVVVRDDNEDSINCSFYGLDHFDKNVRQNLSFGSKITVLNPYYRLASDGSVALRVDDPKTIIYRESGKDNPICRYCWKENPQHSCGKCKRVKYCSRACQTDDWKILKHKMICCLKYFDGM